MSWPLVLYDFEVDFKYLKSIGVVGFHVKNLPLEAKN